MLSSATPKTVIELVSMTSTSTSSPCVLPPLDFGEAPLLTLPLSPLFDNSWADIRVRRQQTSQSPRYFDEFNYRRRPVGLGLSLIGGRKSQEDLVLELLRENPEAARDEVRRQVVR